MATVRAGKVTLEHGEAFAVLVVGRKGPGQVGQADVSIALEGASRAAVVGADDLRAALKPLLTLVGG